jgi:dolichyl-phosphate-mannose--protein O-mannosyl transferase
VRWLPACAALAVGVYLATWSGWLASDDGYLRHWDADQHNVDRGGPVDALASLLHYHQQIVHFWSEAAPQHPYASSPWQWLLLDRAVVFSWSCESACGTSSVVSEVLLLGTPLLWWSFIPVLIALAWLAVARTDWRAIMFAVCALAGLIGPAAFGRSTFLFDALAAEPFLILGAVYLLHLLGRRLWPARPALVVGAYVLVVAACFAYFYPLYVGWPLTHDDWLARMWLGSRWI